MSLPISSRCASPLSRATTSTGTTTSHNAYGQHATDPDRHGGLARSDCGHRIRYNSMKTTSLPRSATSATTAVSGASNGRRRALRQQDLAPELRRQRYERVAARAHHEFKMHYSEDGRQFTSRSPTATTTPARTRRRRRDNKRSDNKEARRVAAD